MPPKAASIGTRLSRCISSCRRARVFPAIRRGRPPRRYSGLLGDHAPVAMRRVSFGAQLVVRRAATACAIAAS